MKKADKKTKIIILVLAIALIGAIVLLGVKSGFVDRVFFNKYTEETEDGLTIEHSNNKEELEKYYDNIEKENDKTENSHGEKKDIGGGLYQYEDGTIETEILP